MIHKISLFLPLVSPQFFCLLYFVTSWRPAKYHVQSTSCPAELWRVKIWDKLPYIHTSSSLWYLDQTRPIPLPCSGSTFSSSGPIHSIIYPSLPQHKPVPWLLLFLLTSSISSYLLEKNTTKKKEKGKENGRNNNKKIPLNTFYHVLPFSSFSQTYT